MKQTFTRLKIEVIIFSSEDVVRTSGAFDKATGDYLLEDIFYEK